MAEATPHGAGTDLSGRELRLVNSMVDSGGSRWEFELRDGAEKLARIKLLGGKKGGFRAARAPKSFNAAEASAGEASWRLYRPPSSLRPKAEVTDLATGTPVATYRSKVFGDGVVEIAASGARYRRRGQPLRKKFRIETETGDAVLALDARRSLMGEGATIAVGHGGLPRDEIVLLAVLASFVLLMYHFVEAALKPRGS